MSTIDQGELLHFWETFEAMSDAQRARVCWAFACISWRRDGRPMWRRAADALPFAWYAVTYLLGIRERRRPAGEQLTTAQRVALALLILAGGCVATGQPWATPAAVFLCVASMGCWNFTAWLDTARQAGAGWPRR